MSSHGARLGELVGRFHRVADRARVGAAEPSIKAAKPSLLLLEAGTCCCGRRGRAGDGPSSERARRTCASRPSRWRTHRVAALTRPRRPAAAGPRSQIAAFTVVRAASFQTSVTAAPSRSHPRDHARPTTSGSPMPRGIAAMPSDDCDPSASPPHRAVGERGEQHVHARKPRAGLGRQSALRARVAAMRALTSFRSAPARLRGRVLAVQRFPRARRRS